VWHARVKQRLTQSVKSITRKKKKKNRSFGFKGVVNSDMSAPKKPKDRSPDQTLLGVSLPKALKERIRKAAARENRTMANWSAHHLGLVIEQIEAEMKSKK
jgi:hypothetical protein